MGTTIFLFMVLMIHGYSAIAQEKTFVKEYTYKAGEMDSKISCRAIATNQLRTELLNEIGVYVESEQLLKTVEVDGKFSQDFAENIATISAGITKLDILEEKWNGEIFWMKAAIVVDRNSLEVSLKQLINDRQKIKELKELKQSLADATKELDRLKMELIVKNKIDSTSQSLNFLKYNNEINTLIATDYVFNADQRFEKKDYKGAIEAYSKAIEINPAHPSAYNNRGASRHYLQDYQGAKEDYSKSIEINPKDADAYYNRGLAKTYLKDYRGAILDYNRVIKINPNDADAYYYRGLNKANLTNYKDSKNDYSKAIEIDPKYEMAYYNRGLARAFLEDYKGAIEDYNKAIEINPIDTDVYYSRGNAKDDLRDYSGAIEDYNKTIEISPKHSKAYYSRGAAKFIIGQKDGACQDLLQSKELGNEHGYEAFKELCN